MSQWTEHEWNEHARLYSEVCNVIERNYHGWPIEQPEDELMHTSKEARAAANRIFEILGIKSPTPEEVIQRMSPEELERTVQYITRSDDKRGRGGVER